MKSLNKKIILGLVMAMVVGVSASCATTEVTNEPVPQVQEVKPAEEVQPSEAVEENETVAETDKNDEAPATKQSYSVGETAIAKSYNMTIDAL